MSNTSNVVIGLNPLADQVGIGGTRTFTATISGTSNKAVTWTVLEGAAGGSVSAAGIYTAPGTPGTYHVVATSAADPTHSATAAVTVLAGSASGAIQ